MMLKEPIKRERLLLSLVITFILVDTCPHPNSPPGFIQTSFQHIQQEILSKNQT